MQPGYTYTDECDRVNEIDACEGDIEEEWVDTGDGDVVPENLYRRHSYYLSLENKYERS